jgi:hypothetical protein
MKKSTINTNQKNVTFQINVFQDGEVIKTKDNKVLTEVYKREYNELSFEFTFLSESTLAQQIGKFIDTLLSSQRLKFNLSKKVYSNQLPLIFEINFQGATFSGKDLINIKPNFVNSKAQIKNLYIGLTKFIGTISGLYKEFSFQSLDTFKVLNGKTKDIETPKEFELKQVNLIARDTVSFNKITTNLQLN